jgi:hypothetical protein
MLNVLHTHHTLGNRTERVVSLEEDNDKLRKEIQKLKAQLVNEKQEAEELTDECLQTEETINDQEALKLGEENIKLRKQLEALAFYNLPLISKGEVFRDSLHKKLEDSKVTLSLTLGFSKRNKRRYKRNTRKTKRHNQAYGVY